MKRYAGMSLDDIRNILEKRENDEVRLGKEIFNDPEYDYRDRKHYHPKLYLDTSKMTPQEELESILSVLGD